MVSSWEHSAAINTSPTGACWWWKQINLYLQESANYLLTGTDAVGEMEKSGLHTA